MRNLIALLLLSVCSSSYSQVLSQNDIIKVYKIALKEFLKHPIIHHEMDKKQLIVMTNDDVESPKRINGIKIAWITDDMELIDVMKGEKTNHNGRSVITVSYAFNENRNLEVSIYQWFISDADKPNYTLTPIETNTEENGNVKNSYVFVWKSNAWIIE